MVVSHLGSHSVEWSLIMVVFQEGDFSSCGPSTGWSLIRVTIQQDGFIRVVSYQVGL